MNLSIYLYILYIIFKKFCFFVKKNILKKREREKIQKKERVHVIFCY